MPESYEFKKMNISNRLLSLKKPFVNIYDYNEAIGLDLNRNRLLIRHLPFEDELLNSIFNDIIKEIILSIHPISKDGFITASKDNDYTFIYSGLRETYLFVYYDSGYTINLAALNHSKSKLNEIVMLTVDDVNAKIKLSKKPISIKNLNTKTSYIVSEYLNPESKKPSNLEISTINNYIKKYVFPYNRKQNIQATIVDFAKNFTEFPLETMFFELYKRIIGDSLLIPYDAKLKLEKYQSFFPELENELNIHQ